MYAIFTVILTFCYAVLSLKERLISALLSQEHRKETELKEMKRRVGDLEEFVLSYFPSSLVQVTGEGKELTTAGKETSFELNVSSHNASSLPFFIKHLSCQLIGPHHQHIHCSITSTQPGVCTVKYTPTLDGPHQLRITISNTEIAGSPFTVHVLPSPEMMGVVQHTITGINRPWGTVVTKSGEVVVSEYYDHCISVYSREGKKIRSFGSEGSSTGQLQYPSGVAITSDSHILVADEINGRIQMFTMEGRYVKSVGQRGEKPLQFYHPSGIAVHSSTCRVFVAEKLNNRIQVLNPDLSYSHMFGSEGSALGQLSFPRDVAINSSGVVYVTDYYNHCVQLFSADGQFISSFGSEESQHGQLYYPLSICVDSTNMVYVTDLKDRVSVYTSSGQFIKCFGTRGRGEGELNFPDGVAVDNTTGALYVCDFSNNRVVVY